MSVKIALLDELNDEISCARGIEAAIFGLSVHADGPTISGVLNLHQRHIERLERFRDDLSGSWPVDRPRAQGD
jgi:hypothetical protein